MQAIEQHHPDPMINEILALKAPLDVRERAVRHYRIGRAIIELLWAAARAPERVHAKLPLAMR